MKERAQDSGVKRFGSSSRLPVLYLRVLNFPEHRGSHLQGSVKVSKDTVTEIPFKTLLAPPSGRIEFNYLSDGGSWRSSLTPT